MPMGKRRGSMIKNEMVLIIWDLVERLDNMDQENCGVE